MKRIVRCERKRYTGYFHATYLAKAVRFPPGEVNPYQTMTAVYGNEAEWYSLADAMAFVERSKAQFLAGLHVVEVAHMESTVRNYTWYDLVRRGALRKRVNVGRYRRW